ncbi:MAG: hypothetical protein K1X66_03290 [Verrucomicrobiae bacterium]|nr:hypothetical protein [Verrucomicrobiae bacterium]
MNENATDNKMDTTDVVKKVERAVDKTKGFFRRHWKATAMVLGAGVVARFFLKKK